MSLRSKSWKVIHHAAKGKKWLQKNDQRRGKRMLDRPWSSFPCFLDFLAFVPFEEFLVFLSVFAFFSRDFRASEETENPCFCWVFLAFLKKARKGRLGEFSESRAQPRRGTLQDWLAPLRGWWSFAHYKSNQECAHVPRCWRASFPNMPVRPTTAKTAMSQRRAWYV